MKCNLALVLLSIAVFCESRLEPLSLDTFRTRISLGLCINEAAKTYFTSDFETITYTLSLAEVRNPKSFFLLSNFVLPEIQANDRASVLVKDLKSPTLHFGELHIKSKSYILQIRERGEFARVIEELETHLSWNPHGKFLVVSSTAFPKPDDVAAEITAAFGKYNVINAAILLADVHNTTNFKVYTWEPFSNSNSSCGTNFFNTRSTDSCSFGVTRNNVAWFNGFSKKLFNCTIKAKYIKWPPYVTNVSQGFQKPSSFLNQGIDVNLLNMIASTLNLVVIYEENNSTEWGRAFMNRTFTGALSSLARNEFDVLLGGYTQSYERSLFFDCSRSYLQDTIVWCVPHEPLTLGLKPMIDILRGEIWVAVILLYIFFTFGIWLLSRNSSKESSTYKRMGNIVLNNFLVFIGFTANTLPRTGIVRFLMGMLIMFCLQLNILYSSYLTSILSSHNFQEKYSTMEYIYQYNLDTYFIKSSKNYFQSYGTLEENYIANVPLSLVLQRWKNCENLTTCVEHLLTSKNSALCVPKLYKEYVFNNIDKLARRKNLMYCLKGQVVTFPIIIIMRRGFPLYDLFQRLMNRISSAGFIAKWEGDILRDKHKYDISSFDTVIDEATIKFKNLLPIFDLFLIGLFLSIVVFIGEFFAHNKKLRRDRLSLKKVPGKSSGFVYLFRIRNIPSLRPDQIVPTNIQNNFELDMI